MVAQNLASEVMENWVYIQGDYIEHNKVQDMTLKLIESYQQISPQAVNYCFQELFLGNQKRINIKLQSQNHVYKTADEDAEGLAGEEFKTEVEKAVIDNTAYYG